MTNEPVAFIDCVSGKPRLIDAYVIATPYDIPLYTHPAKTLTDEEIKELSEKHLDMDWQTGVIEFARAILKKASEK